MKSAWNGGDAIGIEIGLVGHGCNEGDMVYEREDVLCFDVCELRARSVLPMEQNSASIK